MDDSSKCLNLFFFFFFAVHCCLYVNWFHYNDCPLSPLLAFVQTWLDEYSEDFQEPPLHTALRLLLDHLKISSAVHDNMHSEPNFCSMAVQAEMLLKKLLKGDSPPHDDGAKTFVYVPYCHIS